MRKTRDKRQFHADLASSSSPPLRAKGLSPISSHHGLAFTFGTCVYFWTRRKKLKKVLGAFSGIKKHPIPCFIEHSRVLGLRRRGNGPASPKNHPRRSSCPLCSPRLGYARGEEIVVRSADDSSVFENDETGEMFDAVCPYSSPPHFILFPVLFALRLCDLLFGILCP